MIAGIIQTYLSEEKPLRSLTDSDEEERIGAEIRNEIG